MIAPHNPVAHPPPIISNPVNRLGERRTLNLPLSPDIQWSAPPLIGGDWRALPPDQALRVMIRLCADSAPARAICAAHEIAALRMRSLSSILDGLLIEFLARPYADGPARIGAFIYRPGLFDLLDGSSAVLHGIAYEDDLLVETPAQALEYAQLFCAAIQGDEGSFYPAPPDFPVIRNPEDPDHAPSLESLARPAGVESDPDGWRIDLAIAYGVQMFRSQLLLRPSGALEMMDDRPLGGITPVIVEGWAGNLRRHSLVPADGAAADPDAAARDEGAKHHHDDASA